MKAVAAPGAAKPGAAVALNAGQCALCRNRAGIEQGMLVIDDPDGLGRVWRLQRVEGNDHRLFERQRLQLVNQITDAHSALAVVIFAGQIVPRRPDLLAARQQGGVGVQIGAIGLIGKRAENAAFGGIGRGSFLRNDIYQNGQQGIDLGGDGRTANDAGDPDTGPNGRLNFPQFTSYTAPGGTSAVIDVILDTPDIGGNYPARVDFYKAIEDEPGVWLGTTTCAQPNLSCPASFAFPGGVSVTPDDVVVGVVTDAFGKSSEASFYATTTVVTAPDAVLGASYTATVTVTSSAPFSILGDVNVSDGVSESCVATLSVVGPGQSTGSCPLNAVLPLGPRTITGTYSPETPPRRPFSNSSGTAKSTSATAGCRGSIAAAVMSMVRAPET